ncbi:MAG: hypothetical protein F6K39_26180 [Okeania sp. SIO3B3]|nr:hypothetical protein [Okeania sp. SIO3B3]
MLIILVFASPPPTPLLPYSPTQQNVEKFLINGISWCDRAELGDSVSD